RRQAHVGVGRPRVAVDAAVLAAAVGVDRGGEADVGAVVSCNDHLGLFGRNGGGDSVHHLVVERPAVVEGLAHLGLEAAGTVGAGAAPADLLGEGGHGANLARP